MEAAIEEIARLENLNKDLKSSYDKLYREFSMMKLYASDLEKKASKIKNTVTIGNHAEQAKAAMKRFTAKLNEERELNAKQKQS